MRLTQLDELAAGWWAGWSLVAFVAFGLDKALARRGRMRIAEFTLCGLAALGGWPGGLAGMLLFRHKTAKASFQFKFALALVPFAAEVWAWWHWR